MAHLCSAYLGRKVKRFKTSDQEPLWKEEDQLYGFLPPSKNTEPRPARLMTRPADRPNSCKPSVKALSSSCSSLPDSWSNNQSYNAGTCTSARAQWHQDQSYLRLETAITAQELEKRLKRANSLSPANMPMRVTSPHIPTNGWTGSDEVSVNQSSVVNAMYKQGDWLFVRTPDGKEGFIPCRCVGPLAEGLLSCKLTERSDQVLKLKEPLPLEVNNSRMSYSTSYLYPSVKSRDTNRRTSITSENFEDFIKHSVDRYHLVHPEKEGTRVRSEKLLAEFKSMTATSQASGSTNGKSDERTPSRIDYIRDGNPDHTILDSTFQKNYSGPKLVILFAYKGQLEDDLHVRQHEIVTLLNSDDSDWWWVRRQDGGEGFIPASFAVQMISLDIDPNVKTTYL